MNDIVIFEILSIYIYIYIYIYNLYLIDNYIKAYVINKIIVHISQCEDLARII